MPQDRPAEVRPIEVDFPGIGLFQVGTAGRALLGIAG
jgi:hypothetical protein